MAPSYTVETTCHELVADYADIIKGKTILTTGVTHGGIGSFYVEAVAVAKPAMLILAGRSAAKLQEEADIITSKHPDVKVRSLLLDLGSLAAVRTAAAEVLSWDDVPKIDVLVNNAAVMAIDYAVSPDGYEMQFAANHMGHFLLANLIMPKLLAAGEPRVVAISSSGHRMSDVRHQDVNFDGGKVYNKWTAYGQSKTANMLMAISLAEKLGKRGLQAYSVDPGFVPGTALATHLEWTDDAAAGEVQQRDRALGNYFAFNPLKPLSREQGAATYVFASFDPTIKEHNGAYLLQSRLADPYIDSDCVKSWATSPVEARLLWKMSEEIAGQKFSYEVNDGAARRVSVAGAWPGWDNNA